MRAEPPFAVVKNVHDESPAQQAGFPNSCYIINCNGITSTQYKQNAYSTFLSVLKQSENRKVVFYVKETRRDDNVLRFDVVPRRWSGPGLTGLVVEQMN